LKSQLKQPLGTSPLDFALLEQTN